MKTPARNKALTLAILLASMLLGACASAPNAAAPEYPVIYWPGGAEDKLIKYGKSISTDLDVRAITKNEFLFGTKVSVSLKKPTDVAMDIRGVIYATDAQLGGIHIMDEADYSVKDDPGSHRLFRSSEAPSPSGLGYSVALDILAVANTTPPSVALFQLPGMSHILTIRAGEDMQGPADVAFDDGNETMYVVDSKASRIARFGTDGTFHGHIGRLGRAPGEFFTPLSACMGPDGNLYVLDTFNFRYQVIDRSGRAIATYGGQGRERGMFIKPSSIAAGPKGRVYITDAGKGRILVFDRSGKILFEMGNPGERHGRFKDPLGIFITPQGRMAVADSGNSRLQIFNILLTPEEQ